MTEEAPVANSSKPGLHGIFDGSPALETLKGRIMAEIEARLSQKEESLWRRGQVEIRRLQLEQQQVTSCVSKLQERQAALVTENQKIRGALLEVTSKFELVVKEMREVLRALPQRNSSVGEHLSPSPSVASTSASEVAREEQPAEQTPGSTVNTEPSAAWSIERCRRNTQTPVSTQTPLPMWHPRGTGEGGLTELPSFDAEELSIGDSKTFCTPPRTSAAAEDVGPLMDLVMAPPPPPSWQGTASVSPAVLSLASALPSASAASLMPTPSTGLKRLHLAECLEQAASGGAAPSGLDAAMATPPNPPRHREPTPSSTLTPTRNFDFVGVELVKEPGFVTLGIEVNQIDCSSLRIERIDEHGLVGRHNARQDSDLCRMRVGDRIIEANGIRHDPHRMLHECKVRQRLAFTLARDSGAGLAEPHEAAGAEECLLSSAAADEPAAAAEVSKADAGSPTRLRPEAQVFVPSAQKEAAPGVQVPPGLEGYDPSGLPVAPVAATCSSALGVVLATAPPWVAEGPAEVSEPVMAQACTPGPAAPDGQVEEDDEDEEEVKRALFQ